MEKAREFYEQETGRRCRNRESQVADGRRLSGAAVAHQPHERRPCGICCRRSPTLLHGGGPPSGGRLAVLRKACVSALKRRALGRHR